MTKYVSVVGKQIKVPESAEYDYLECICRRFEELYKNKNYMEGKISDDVIDYIVNLFYKHNIKDKYFHSYISFLFQILEMKNFDNTFISVELLKEIAKMACLRFQKEDCPNSLSFPLGFYKLLEIFENCYPSITLTNEEVASFVNGEKCSLEDAANVLLGKVNWDINEEMRKKIIKFAEINDYGFSCYYLSFLASDKFRKGVIKNEHLEMLFSQRDYERLIFNFSLLSPILTSDNYRLILNKHIELLIKLDFNQGMIMSRLLSSKFYVPGHIKDEYFNLLHKDSNILSYVIDCLLDCSDFELEERYSYSLGLLELGDSIIDTLARRYKEFVTEPSKLYTFPSYYIKNYMINDLSDEKKRKKN